MVKKWRTRTKGTKRQKGKRFVLGSSQQKLKTKLKPVTATTKSLNVMSNIRSSKTGLLNVRTRIKATKTKTPKTKEPKTKEPKTRISKSSKYATQEEWTREEAQTHKSKIRGKARKLHEKHVAISLRSGKTHKGFIEDSDRDSVILRRWEEKGGLLDLRYITIKNIKSNPCVTKKRKKRSVPKWAQKKGSGGAQEYLDRSTVRKQIA